MYKIVYILVVLSLISCNSSNEEIYINDRFDVIYINDTSIVFYSNHCIVPYKVNKTDSGFKIPSMSFYCRKDRQSYDVNMNIIIQNNLLIIESEDSCFVEFFNSSKNDFIKVKEMAFNFEWDEVKIRNFNNFKDETINKYLRGEMPYKELIKLWIISQQKYKLVTKCTDCFYTSFIFYKNNKIVLEKTTSVLPCWYIVL